MREAGKEFAALLKCPLNSIECKVLGYDKAVPQVLYMHREFTRMP